MTHGSAITRRLPEPDWSHFVRLHEGRGPDYAAEIGPRAAVRSPWTDLGQLASVTYIKRVPPHVERGGWKWYRHEFKPHARPMLAHDHAGQLRTYGGQYTTTDRGITDAPQRGETKMAEQGIRYAGGYEGARTYENPSNPNPNPYANPYLNANPYGSYGNPTHEGYYRAQESPEMSFVKNGLKVGLTVSVASGLGTWATNKTRWNYAARGAAQGAAGLLLGFGAVKARMPMVGVGLLAYGITATIIGGMTEIKVRGYLKGATAAPLSPAAATGNATLPQGASAGGTSPATGVRPAQLPAGAVVRGAYVTDQFGNRYQRV